MNSDKAYNLTYRTGISNIELEEIISKDDDYSYFYAKDVLNVRFELGEVAIIKDCHYSWSYAINVLKGRFKLGERSLEHLNFKVYCYAVLRYNHE